MSYRTIGPLVYLIEKQNKTTVSSELAVYPLNGQFLNLHFSMLFRYRNLFVHFRIEQCSFRDSVVQYVMFSLTDISVKG